MNLLLSLLLFQTAPDVQLDKAIAAMRGMDKVAEADQEKKAKELDAAWKVITAKSAEGRRALKAESSRIAQAGEKDDIFRLGAAALLWQMGRFEESAAIAEIWRTARLDAQYNYVFYTAFEAAATRDARVVPMLEALLRSREGSVYVAQHAMKVAWPLSIEFVWGAYGSKGLPELARILETSDDAVSKEGALLLLASALDPKALPVLRQWAANTTTSPERYLAWRLLGAYGHPADFELLASSALGASPEAVFFRAFALYEYEDPRGVPVLLSMLKDCEGKPPYQRPMSEVVMALWHLNTVESLEAVQGVCRKTAELCERTISSELTKANATVASFVKLTGPGLRDLSAKRKAAPVLKRTLTRTDWAKVLAHWRQRGRAMDENPEDPYGWVTEDHAKSVATSADRDALLDAKASVYRRLSDECLYETRRLDRVIHHAVRKAGRN